MSIYEFAVKRPVTISMIFLALVCLGLRSIIIIPQELFPALTFPQLTIVTPYANAAPEEIENLVTKPVEEAISTVKNLKAVRSYSRVGVSVVIAEFNWGTDMNFASLNLREKIDLIKERLPREAEEPLVLKFNPFSKPIMIYSLTAIGDPKDPTTLKMHELLEIAKTRLKDKLEKVQGVASVGISGGQEEEIEVSLDLSKLVAQKINIQDIPDILKNTNLNYPAGSIKEEFFEYLVRTMGEYKTKEDIEDTLVSIENIKRGVYDRAEKERVRRTQEDEKAGHSDRSDRFVLVRDVAKVSETFKEKTSHSRYRNKENISLNIQKQAEANVIAASKAVKKELHRLTSETNLIPPNVDLSLIYDESAFIETAISGVVNSAIMGGILAFFVLLVFLRSLKSALIVAVTIPMSVLASFIAMDIFGITINMMSLGGLALGIGMLVDNAIVVVENINRFTGQGKDLITSCIDATKEVFTAVFSSTLTTVAVFLPLAFVFGIAGQLFKPISFTIVFSLTASLFVSITLIPRLSAIQLFQSKTVATTEEEEDGVVFMVLKNIYARTLDIFLNLKWIGFLGTVAAFMGSLLFIPLLETEIMPKVDQGQFQIKIKLPTGTRLEKTNELAMVLEWILEQHDDVESFSLAVGSDRNSGNALNALGSHEAQLFVTLKKSRQKETDAVLLEIQTMMDQLRQVGAYDGLFPAKENLSNPPPLPLGTLKLAEITYILEDNPFAGAFDANADLGINIMGKDMDALKQYVAEVEAMLATIPGVVNVRNDIPSQSPEMRILPLRSRAALEGVSASDIAKTALLAIRGSVATKIKRDGREIDVIVRLQKEDLEGEKAIDTLKNIPLFVDDKIVTLNAVSQIQDQGLGPSEVTRLDQTRIHRVFGDVRDRSLNEVMADLEKKFKEMTLKENYYVGFGKEYEEKKKSQTSMIIAFLISIALVYGIMAAQFESLWQPFIIMMSVPLSVIGVVLSLLVTGISINAMSMLGLIMLGGIVVNNAIVLLEFINNLRSEGHPLRESVINGCKTRLRPILMTTLTTLLGLIPLALKLEEGSEMQQPLAISVIGGLLVSTCLTLYIIPAIYEFSEQMFLKLKKRNVKV